MVVWLEEGVTELHWHVPVSRDIAAFGTTGAATLLALVLVAVNRRPGWEIDPHRRRPAAEVVQEFADTVDGWLAALAATTRRAAGTARAKPG